MVKGKREEILQEAEKLVARGKLDAAIKEYRRALDLAPHDTNTLNRLGDLLVKVDRVDEAVDVYQRIAEHFADDGFFLKAIAIFKKINRLDPQRTEIYERLADLYFKQGLAVEGRQQLVTLAEWHIRSRQFEEAVRVYRKLAGLEPSNFQSRAKLVDVLIQQGDVEAVTDEIDDLGQALLERGMVEEAVKLYHRAIELHPQRGNFVATCLDTLLEGARLPQAVELAEKALAGTGGGIELKRAAGQVLAAANQLGRAQVLLEEIYPQAAERFDVVQAYADVLLRSDDIDRALEVVLPAIDRLIGARDARRAVSLLKRLLKKASGNVAVLERAARVFDRESEPEVLQTVEAALAEAYFKDGRVTDALPIYRRLVEQNPADRLAAARLAEIEGSGGETERAPAEEAPPPAAVVAATADEPADEAEFVEVDLDLDDSAPAFEEPVAVAAKSQPESSASPVERGSADTTVEELFTEATVFAKYGLAEKAIMHLQRLLEIEPSHAAAHELLAGLAGGAPEAPGAPEPAVEVPEPVVEVPEPVAQVPAPMEPEPPAAVEPVAAVEDQPAIEFAAPDADGGADAVGWQEAEGEKAFSVELPDEIFAPVGEPQHGSEPEIFEATPEALPDVPLPSFEAPADVATPAQEAAHGSTAAPSKVDEPAIPAPVGKSPAPRRPAPGSISLDDLEAALGISRSQRPGRPEGRPRESAEIDLSAVLGSVGGSRPAQSPGRTGRVPAPPEPAAAIPAAPAPPKPTQPARTAEPEPGVAAAGEVEIAIEAVEVGAGAEEFVDVADVLAGPDEERLREIDFLIEQGLLEDAGKILGGLREESGDHPEIGARQAALKARGWDETAPEAASDSAESLFSEEEQFFDLAAELERELADEELVAEATGMGQGAEVSIEDLFKEFQRGVAEQVSEEDFDTHFNLGLAYREMGLFDEAIGEFQMAGKSASYAIECATMIGACYMDKGLPEQAAEWYDRALRTPDLPAEAELGLRYELGRTQEAAGNTGAALSYYAEVLAINPGFRDVVDRVSRLQSN